MFEHLEDLPDRVLSDLDGRAGCGMMNDLTFARHFAPVGKALEDEVRAGLIRMG